MTTVLELNRELEIAIAVIALVLLVEFAHFPFDLSFGGPENGERESERTGTLRPQRERFHIAYFPGWP